MGQRADRVTEDHYALSEANETTPLRGDWISLLGASLWGRAFLSLRVDAKELPVYCDDIVDIEAAMVEGDTHDR